MQKETSAKMAGYNGIDCVELRAGGYYALIAPPVGSSVLRLYDERRGLDFFRFFENVLADELKAKCEIYGFPTLYLPNRLDRGILKTSDGIYHFPQNEGEPLNTYIHGFLHRREHRLIELAENNNGAVASTEYVYGENDPMFPYFPLKFRAEINYILSKNGLEQYFTITNLSKKMLPVGIGSHTAIKAPFDEGGRAEDIRICLPVGERVELDSRCLSTGKFLPLLDHDLKYKKGKANPAIPPIDNEMYTAKTMLLNGETFHGAIISNVRTGKKIFYETGEEYGFWILWNEWGGKGYFCPEPMTWMVNAPNLELPAKITGYREIAPGTSFTAYQHFFSAD